MQAFSTLAVALVLSVGSALAVSECVLPTTSSGVDVEFSIDYFASEWGAYKVKGCEGTSPTLKMARGVTYTMVQKDTSNWMHPLGLAYYPDGAHGFGTHETVPELEHPTPEDCDTATFKCNPGTGVEQAPLYCINNVCETYADWNNGATGGLDKYEPMFKIPHDQWTEGGGAGMYAVKITIPANSATTEFFYFCHIHSGMSGKIVVVGDPTLTAPAVANTLQIPFVPATYYQAVDAFDTACGTFGIHTYSGAGHDKFCPHDNFLCEPKNDVFSKCMKALDCKMSSEMRVHESGNPLETFMKQMIPHHQNAVNMAKAIMKLGTESTGYNDDIKVLLVDIMATQNMQIQTMQAWLGTAEHKTTAVKTCSPVLQTVKTTTPDTTKCSTNTTVAASGSVATMTTFSMLLAVVPSVIIGYFTSSF